MAETLLAGAIILMVFFASSLTINNVFRSSLKKDKAILNSRLNELRYYFKNDQLVLPYFEEHKKYDIEVVQINNEIQWKALHKVSGDIVEFQMKVR